MAKKTQYTFSATLMLNPEKGGGWLAVVSVVGDEEVKARFTTAWKNASAGKKYVKAMVQELTPRKSVKMIAGDQKDAKGKPVSFAGELTFKA